MVTGTSHSHGPPVRSLSGTGTNWTAAGPLAAAAANLACSVVSATIESSSCHNLPVAAAVRVTVQLAVASRSVTVPEVGRAQAESRLRPAARFLVPPLLPDPPQLSAGPLAPPPPSCPFDSLPGRPRASNCRRSQRVSPWAGTPRRAARRPWHLATALPSCHGSPASLQVHVGSAAGVECLLDPGSSLSEPRPSGGLIPVIMSRAAGHPSSVTLRASAPDRRLFATPEGVLAARRILGGLASLDEPEVVDSGTPDREFDTGMDCDADSILGHDWLRSPGLVLRHQRGVHMLGALCTGGGLGQPRAPRSNARRAGSAGHAPLPGRGPGVPQP